MRSIIIVIDHEIIGVRIFCYLHHCLLLGYCFLLVLYLLLFLRRLLLARWLHLLMRITTRFNTLAVRVVLFGRRLVLLASLRLLLLGIGQVFKELIR